MRSAPIAMTGATLCFDRSGTRLLVVQPDAITVVDAAVRRTTRLSRFPAARSAGGLKPIDAGRIQGLQTPKDDPPEQAH